MTPNTTGQPGRHPVAYLRRSKVDAANPGAISQETQLAAVRKMAAGEDLPLDIRQDWGKSGRGSKLATRSEFGEVLKMIAADKVSTLYSYNLSRLGRSVDDLRTLAKLCHEHGTRIRLEDGPEVNAGSATGGMLLTILAAVDEWQAEVQAERTIGGLNAYRARNVAAGLDPSAGLGRQPYGTAPGEDLQAVIEAVKEAGSFLGAVKLMKERAYPPTRLGGDWDVRTVARLFRRVQEALPAAERTRTTVKRGVSALRSTRLFSQLLRCGAPGCNTILTSMPRAGSVGYYCIKAHKDRRHPRPYVVSERRVRAIVEPWTDALRTITFAVAPAAIAEGARLDEKRRQVVDMAADSVITRADRDARLAVIEADRAKVDTSQRADKIGARVIDWTAPASETNVKLRALWDHVVMNGGMLPKRAVWRPTLEYGPEGPDDEPYDVAESLQGPRP